MTAIGIGIGIPFGTSKAAAWTPADLFSGGLVGAYYNVSDLSSLYSDRSDTPSTPASVNGAVGTIKDLSGNDFHMIAPSDAARPILRQSGSTYYLEPDGVDDWMKPTATLDLTSSWHHIGVWKSAGSDKRAFTISSQFAPGYGALRDYLGNQWGWYNNTPLLEFAAESHNDATHVVTVEQPSSASLTLRMNGVATSLSIVPADISAETYQLALFTQRNTAYLNGWPGRFYGGMWARGTISSDNRALAEAYFGSLYA